MISGIANTPEEYRKPSPGGGNAPLSKNVGMNRALSDASVRIIRNAALRKDVTQRPTETTRKSSK